ncbi:butyrate kinase [Peptoniphilaceae bacterium SGI.137]|nr:butyrate kinase [Peptoniphilaceae bacterium]
MKKILVFNLGSISTKIGYFEDGTKIYQETVNHSAQELSKYETIWDQEALRLKAIQDFMKAHALSLSEMDALVSRGGHTQAIESGTYVINQAMLDQQRSGKFGQHAADLGSLLASRLVSGTNIPAYIVDSPVSDEFQPLAKYAGHPLFYRKSSFHALSHKATAKRYAKDIGKAYEDLNLIVAHLGGGISVAPHRNGKMIDGDNALTGDGTFSTDRSGGLPVGQLVDLCFSGKYSYEEVRKMLQGKGGLVAYTGSSDVKELTEKGKTDPKVQEALDAMIYQICKEIGSMATVLHGQVDAILLTGGIAYSDYVVDKIKESCSFIAKIVVYPGENEMQSLANGALEVLNGEIKAKVLIPNDDKTKIHV